MWSINFCGLEAPLFFTHSAAATLSDCPKRWRLLYKNVLYLFLSLSRSLYFDHTIHAQKRFISPPQTEGRRALIRDCEIMSPQAGKVDGQIVVASLFSKSGLGGGRRAHLNPPLWQDSARGWGFDWSPLYPTGRVVLASGALPTKRDHFCLIEIISSKVFRWRCVCVCEWRWNESSTIAEQANQSRR